MPGTRSSLSRSVLCRPSATVAASIVLAASVVLSGCSSGTSVHPSSSSQLSALSSHQSSSRTSSGGAATGAGAGHAGGTGFCRGAALAQAAQAKAAGAFNGSSSAALKQIEQQGLTELHALASTAPSAIKGSVTVLVAADEKLYSALDAADFDVRKVDPTVLSDLSSPGFTKAVQAITDYLSTACGLSVSPSA